VLYKSDGSTPINACQECIANGGLLHDQTSRDLLLEKITELEQTKEALRLNEARFESLLRITQHKFTSDQELMNLALEEALLLTGSSIVFIQNYDEKTNEFSRNSWSKEVMEECRITGSRSSHPLEKTGMWAEAVRQRRPIVFNDFHSLHSLMKG